MTMTDTTPTTVPPLPASELARFDDESVRLIRTMESAGWRGRVSARGHAIMRAPDGITTASVTKDHDKHRRTRQNAWAEFDRWQRRATTDTIIHLLEDSPMAIVLVCPEC